MQNFAWYTCIETFPSILLNGFADNRFVCVRNKFWRLWGVQNPKDCVRHTTVGYVARFLHKLGVEVIMLLFSLKSTSVFKGAVTVISSCKQNCCWRWPRRDWNIKWMCLKIAQELECHGRCVYCRVSLLSNKCDISTASLTHEPCDGGCLYPTRCSWWRLPQLFLLLIKVTSFGNDEVSLTNDSAASLSSKIIIIIIIVLPGT